MDEFVALSYFRTLQIDAHLASNILKRLCINSKIREKHVYQSIRFSVLVSNHAQELILIARTCDSRKRSFKLFDQLAMHAKPRYKLVRVIKERNANKPWRFLEKVLRLRKIAKKIVHTERVTR